MSDSKQKILDIMSGVLKLSPAEIERVSDFEKLNVSSLDAVTIAFEIEEAFQITIPDDSVYAVKNVDELTKRVQDELAR